MPPASFGQQLRAWRKTRRLNQKQLAEQAQVSVRAVIYWESDQFTPSEYELRALLKVLKIPASEQLILLSLMPTKRGDRIIQGLGLTEIRSVTMMPTVGDLLNALRSRRGLTREQVARALGIETTTWRRWEKNQYALPNDLLPRVQTLLNASAAEVEALQNRLIVPLDDTPFSVELAQEWAVSFAYHRYRLGRHTVDLDALALQRKLWCLHWMYPEVRLPLAKVTTDYAAWLVSQNRTTEATHQSRQALRLYEQDKNPFLSIAGPLSLLSVGQTYMPGNPGGLPSPKIRSGMQILNHWLPYLGRPTVQTMVLTDMGILAGRLNQFDMAQHYFLEAQQTLAQTQGDQEPIRKYVQYWYAQMLLVQQRPLEALNAMPHAIPDPEQTAPGIGRFEFLIYTRLMHGLGEHSQAQKWLSHIYTSLDTVEIPLLRTLADALAQHLQ